MKKPSTDTIISRRIEWLSLVAITGCCLKYGAEESNPTTTPADELIQEIAKQVAFQGRMAGMDLHDITSDQGTIEFQVPAWAVIFIADILVKNDDKVQGLGLMGAWAPFAVATYALAKGEDGPDDNILDFPAHRLN